ncbi:MAG: 3-phosphoshikimate 1-carboxyvinyltransferase [bacterium]|nr:3-phosphoshikimate 1-carboxyvinyltransferase [bacterium]
MNLVCQKSVLKGGIDVPGSKSHTIRAVAIASLAAGESRIERPLLSEDAQSAAAAYRALGAKIDMNGDVWHIQGLGGELRAPENVIDAGNSGTTLRMVMGSCALLRSGAAVLTGDAQIRTRPSGPLADSLTDLGADVFSTRGNGSAPFVARGRMWGGQTTIEAVTSQYLSSLLLNAPLADGDTTIRVPLLNEKPYVEITLDWLKRQGVTYERDGWRTFRIRGGQQYQPVTRPIPGDWSSATFFLAAGALPGNTVDVRGVEMNDTQGDKAVLDYLRAMGAQVDVLDDGVRVTGGELTGCDLDLNATPDALPMMAVLACFARGRTRLLNVAQARVKETDRIAVMRKELEKLGATVSERPDGLVIEESALHGGIVEGHDDHRVVMALAIGATQIDDPTTIRGYEAAAITYRGFAETLGGLGGTVRTTSETD